MTSIEWLIDKLGISEITHKKLFEQAKEMHKQEIIDAAERWKGTDFAERYYQETFVSKGSDTLKDYHIVDTNEMVELPKQETLYTEEQVREAIDMARRGIITDVYGDLEVEYLLEKEQIIQSLKQPKKD